MGFIGSNIFYYEKKVIFVNLEWLQSIIYFKIENW